MIAMRIYGSPSAAAAASSVTARSVLEISVIIVSWNARNYLAECLNSLERGISRTCEVVVVDNASQDGSPEMVAEKFPWVRLILTGDNLGFAKGNNLAIEQARGRYICLINSDVNVFPGCLDSLADYLDKHLEVGMVGPRILNPDRSLQNTCRSFPTLWNNFCVVSGLSLLFPASSRFSGEEMLWFDHARELPVDALVGCFIMARLEAVQQFGLLSDDFFMFGEDIDWGRRCWESGWKVVFFPGAESVHYGGASSANAPERFAVEAQRAALQLWAKHHSRLRCFLFRCLLLSFCLLRALREVAVAAVRLRWNSANHLRWNTQMACLLDLWPWIRESSDKGSRPLQQARQNESGEVDGKEPESGEKMNRRGALIGCGFRATISFLSRYIFRLYDFYYKVTRRHRRYDFSLDVSHESATAARYSSVSLLQTRIAIRRLGPLAGLTFCDIGCGKGRVLFAAAEYPFSRILGVELFADFARVAEQNLEKWRASGGDDRIAIACADATTFVYPAEAAVYYFFNPFPATVLGRVLDQIEASHRGQRTLLLIVHPVSDSYPNILLTRPFRLVKELDHAFSRSLIYERV